MPLFMKKIGVLSFLVFLLSLNSFAQPDAAVRKQLSRARVLLATKNYNAAILELTAIRKDTQDEYVQGVALSMLMNVYIEQSDYKKAQDLLTEIYTSQKASKKNSSVYFATAAQIVRGSKLQVDRYRSLGLNIRDDKLPAEANADIDKMRNLLELVVKQTEELGAEKKQTEDSMALIEESANARSNMARDEYDASRWKTKIIDAREKMATSRSTVVNVVEDGNANSTAVLTTPKPQPTPFAMIPVKTTSTAEVAKTPAKIELKPLESTTTIIVGKENLPTAETARTDVKIPTVENNQQPEKPIIVENTSVATKTTAEPKIETSGESTTAKISDEPMQIGSLREYAIASFQPQYPVIAKSMRLSGIVQVDLLVDEAGKVATIQNSSGPDVLKRAATDAVKRWKFRPFTRDGLPVKATGFVKFNFAL
jgi:TonB family protein